MNPRHWLRPAAASLLVISMLVLAGCVSDPARLAPGVSRDQALQQLGAPTAVYALPTGQRLQYSREPAGWTVTNVDVDASGRVVAVTQALNEALFDRTIKPGVWREADVLRTYGRPFEISQVASFEGVVWAWHYRAINEPRLLYIYIDPQGVVQRYNVADDLTANQWRW